MEVWTSVMASRVVLLYILAVVGQSALAMDEQPPETVQSQRLNTFLSAMGVDDPAEKRAYTYVSEYKRLPVYNFGIGKRWADYGEDKRVRQYAFGLGKRTREYSFGLGKREDGQEYNPMDSNMDYLSIDGLEGLHARQQALDDFVEAKRSRQRYNFGLGKRALNYATSGEVFGTGKRPNDPIRYHFGLGKRIAEDDDTTQ